MNALKQGIPKRGPSTLICLVLSTGVSVLAAGCSSGRSSPQPVGSSLAPPAGDSSGRVRGAAAEPIPLVGTDRFAQAVAEPWTASAASVSPLRVEALAERAFLRAYDGAPPVIPHEIEQMTSSACLRCHGWSLEADERAAPKVPHVILANCTQCHVEEVSEYFSEIELTENTFQGRPAPADGHRAYEHAPPVIPHTIHMRSACLSCHGAFGKPATRSATLTPAGSPPSRSLRQRGLRANTRQ
jgi:cytochrome c-type protein NapB